MCIITEHARAKQKIQRLEADLASLKERLVLLKEQYEPLLPTNYPTFDITWSELKSELGVLGIQCMLKSEHIADDFIRHTDKENWTKIMPFLVYSADYYVSGVADCDDYSRWAAADSSRLFKLNGCLECWGESKWGYHAYNLIRIAPNEYRISEPNAGAPWAGELLKFGEESYLPQYWRL